jgi:hypothetical protein
MGRHKAGKAALSRYKPLVVTKSSVTPTQVKITQMFAFGTTPQTTEKTDKIAPPVSPSGSQCAARQFASPLGKCATVEPRTAGSKLSLKRKRSSTAEVAQQHPLTLSLDFDEASSNKSRSDACLIHRARSEGQTAANRLQSPETRNEQQKPRGQSIQDEERRVQQRWSQEDLLTLCSSRVPPAREARNRGAAEAFVGEIERGSTHFPPQQGGSDELERCRQVTECIDLADSSDEEQAAGKTEDGKAVEEEEEWDDEWQDDGVVMEDEPDEEDLGVSASFVK